MSPENNIPKNSEGNPPLTGEKKAQKFKKRRRRLVKKFSKENFVLDESTSPQLTSKNETPKSLKPKGKNMKKFSKENFKLGESSSGLPLSKKETLASPDSKGEVVKKPSDSKEIQNSQNPVKFSNEKSILDESASKKETPKSLKPKRKKMKKSSNENVKLGESSSGLSPLKKKTLASPNPKGEVVKKPSNKKPTASNSKEIQNSQKLVKKTNKKLKPVNNQNNKAEVAKKGSHSGKEKEVENSTINHSRDNDTKKLGGFIFMCNAKTKGDCFKYRVMGIQSKRKDLVSGIKPGTKLFLFDFGVKLLYGMYKATSAPCMKLESDAFHGEFPLQVRFEVLKDCLPLPESVFKNTIKENYDGKSRQFRNELTVDQVKRLTKLFKPAPVLHSNPQPAVHKPAPVLHLNPQPVVHEPKPNVASSPLLLTEQDYRNFGLRGDRHKNLTPVAPPAYDPYRPGLDIGGARMDPIFISRPEQEILLVKPTLTSPPASLIEHEYRSYGLRGDVPPPVYDLYKPDQERDGAHPETVYLSRPSEQGSNPGIQLRNPTLASPPAMLTEQGYRSYGLRGDRALPVYDPYKPDQERDRARPEAVYLSRLSEQGGNPSMQLLNPTLASHPVLLTEQGYRSYGLRGDRPPPAYDPYKIDQERNYTQAPPDALFLSEKDYRTYGLKSRQDNPYDQDSAIGVHQSVPHNPYDQDSDLVERYLPHHVALPSSSYRYDPETVVSDRVERLYAGNASSELLNHYQNAGQRVDETEHRSAPVSSRYAFAGPSVVRRYAL